MSRGATLCGGPDTARKCSRRIGIRRWITQLRSAVSAGAVPATAFSSAASQSATLVSQPSVTPLPPYSSFGFSTSESR